MALWKINKQDDDKNQTGNESDGDSVLYTDRNCNLVTFSPNVTGTQLWTSEGHTQRITSIMYSSHGDLIVTASYDQTACLWDAESGQCRAVIQDFQDCVNDIAWVETPNARYVVAGCEDGTVGMWQVIMEHDRYQVRLHWKTTNGTFNAEDVIIQDVQGLSPLNERILMTRVAAVGDGESEGDDESEESDEGEEGEEGEEWVEWVECEENEENEECEKVVNQRAGLPLFEGHPVKRLLELDEEDEDVAKRMRSNEGVNNMEQ
ncbi:hypothetical protein BGX34_005566 [Mortierella sp. NVP85]|nr:hypothetical protein BGX34_005566 [Mortierella sp. NVP85]